MRRAFTWRHCGLGLGAAFLCLQGMAADIRILTAGAVKPVLLAVQPAFEAQSGHRLLIDNDTAGGLQRRVIAGESFDLVISSPASLMAMRQAGKLSAAPPMDLARVAIGVAVQPNSPLPAIATVDQFRQALANATRIAIIDPASGGSSGVYLDALFARWGIRDEIRAKAILVPGGLVARHLLDGSADLAIHQISEIKAVPGVTLVGPLPAEIQNHTVYAAAVSQQGPEAVRDVLTFLSSPRWLSLWQDKGMEPLLAPAAK